MDKNEIAQKLEKLESLTKRMDVPDFKRRNVYWLRKHLAVRNDKHPNFQETITLINELANKGVSGA